MIKLPFSVDDLDQMATEFYTDIETNFSLKTKIQNHPNDNASPFFDYIKSDLDKIIGELITGKPAVLESYIDIFEPYVTQCKQNYLAAYATKTEAEVNLWFKNTVLQYFNYDYDHLSFTKRFDGRLAYQHAIKLASNTCPYCNAQFTFTIKNKEHKTRPQFDHFFDKARHPYFAISFYNLIPSCSVCNSSLKGSDPFKYSTHLHPFMESMNELYVFRTNIKTVDFLVDNEKFSISIAPVDSADANDLVRANRNIEAFAIEDRYQFHIEYAGEIIKKSYIYDDSTIKELLYNYTKPNGEKLFSSEEEILELLLGNHIHKDKLHKRILSKLTKDVAEEFGIKL